MPEPFLQVLELSTVTMAGCMLGKGSTDPNRRGTGYSENVTILIVVRISAQIFARHILRHTMRESHHSDDLVERQAQPSGDLLSLRPYFGFHSCLSLQALEITRDGYDSERATAFLVRHGTIACIEAALDLAFFTFMTNLAEAADAAQREV